MKKSTLSLSLLIGAALTIPSLAMAAPADTAAVDVQSAATATTLEMEGDNTNNASTDNQSSPFQISETQIISRASTNNVNNSANQQPMTTELQAEQEAMDAEQELIQDSEEAMQEEDSLDTQEELQEAEEATEEL
ncbi:hypothetical protein [Psychrobacter immobilis]|uniref:hypothetical protein n=1 Tax=Psychrobacter immobilis TaxID=498 RepID=UPI0019190408|nr:hypothetical protein [Psychrobacter immobilis]